MVSEKIVQYNEKTKKLACVKNRVEAPFIPKFIFFFKHYSSHKAEKGFPLIKYWLNLGWTWTSLSPMNMSLFPLRFSSVAFNPQGKERMRLFTDLVWKKIWILLTKFMNIKGTSVAYLGRLQSLGCHIQFVYPESSRTFFLQLELLPI